jgi:hypothetical protein
MRELAAVVILAMAGAAMAAAMAQSDATQPTVAAQMTEMLQRGASGHSPTPEEIRAVESEPGVTDAAVAKEAVPLLAKALNDADGAMRQYGLAMLVGMQSLPDPVVTPVPASGDAAAAPAAAAVPAAAVPAAAVPAAAKGTAGIVASAGPAAYKGEVAKALTPAIPGIAARLTDDDPENRALAATVLGGFAPDPPAAVFSPLLGYLKRDDAVGAVGLAVVGDLLQFGRVSDETAAAITKYLRRPDQTSDERANLVEAIAAKPNQSQTVNKALLSYLDSDDAGLRARVILSLPQLDLTADVFAETKARVSDLAAGGQDSLQVVNAAKSVAKCWTAVKMTTGCPVY